MVISLRLPRKLESNFVAFAKCDSTFATIDHLGEVDMEPDYTIR